MEDQSAPLPATHSQEGDAPSVSAGVLPSPGVSGEASSAEIFTTEPDLVAHNEDNIGGVGGAPEGNESDEPDNSSDDDYSLDSDASNPSEDEGQLTAESAESAGSDVDDTEDISVFLMDVNLQQQVSSLIAADECEDRCLEGKAREHEWLVCSISQMTKQEKTTSLYTLLGVLMQTPTAERRRGYGLREKFHYYLPFVVRVCRPSFARCYGVVPLTVPRYKTRVRDGNIAVKAHGNTLNAHASAVDLVWLVKWFTEFAEEVGEVVPVRVRIQKTKDGKVQKNYSSEMYTMLPAHFTWDALYEQMQRRYVCECASPRSLRCGSC